MKLAVSNYIEQTDMPFGNRSFLRGFFVFPPKFAGLEDAGFEDVMVNNHGG